MLPAPEPAQRPKQLDLTSDRTVGLGIFILDLIAILFWAYTITTLFILDLPRYFFEKLAPDYVWLLDFKIILFLGAAAFAALFIKKSSLALWGIYIIAFPFVLFLWKLPKHVIKTGSLNIIFYFIFTLISFFKRLKYNIFASFISLTSGMIVLIADNKFMLYAAIFCLLGLLVGILGSRIFEIFKPGDTLIVLRKIMGWWQDMTIKKIAEDKDFQSFQLMNPGDTAVQKALSNVELGLISNRLMLFSAKSLRAYQNSGIIALSGVFVTVFLFITSIVFFSIIYYAIYKIDSANYTFAKEPTGFVFFALSFKAMFFTTINELNPATTLSQAINIAQNSVALFIVVIFVSIIISSRNQMLSYQIDETINRLRADGQSIERAMFGQYHIESMDELLAELRRLQSGMIVIAEFFTKRL